MQINLYCTKSPGGPGLAKGRMFDTPGLQPLQPPNLFSTHKKVCIRAASKRTMSGRNTERCLESFYTNKTCHSSNALQVNVRLQGRFSVCYTPTAPKCFHIIFVDFFVL